MFRKVARQTSVPNIFIVPPSDHSQDSTKPFMIFLFAIKGVINEVDLFGVRAKVIKIPINEFPERVASMVRVNDFG